MRKILILVLLFLITTSVSAVVVDGDYYQIQLSEGFKEIEKQNQLFVRTFISENMKIRIFNQDIGKHSFESYIEYGNKQLYEGKASFQLISREEKLFSGIEAEIFQYKRPEIKNIAADKNYYIEAHFYDQRKNRAITIWGKSPENHSSELVDEVLNILGSLRLTEEGLRYAYYSPYFGQNKEVSLIGENSNIFIPEDKLLWGRFSPGYPFYKNSDTRMMESEEELDYKFEFLMTYKTFPSKEEFPIEKVREVYKDGRVLMLTLQPFTKDLSWIAIPEFIEGKHDQKIIDLAEKLSSLNEPVFIRPLNEMNGDWDPWNAWFFGKDTDLYINAWQHIINLMREHGGEKLQFVWNPHDRSYPDFSWNNPHLYYPGDDYVDWVGMTGYNNGTSHPGDVWRDFDEIYRPLYIDYLRRYSKKPFMITEFSCNEEGGFKAQWIKEGFASLANNYPNIKIATWFDGLDGLWQYQINSSPEAFSAFKEGIQNPGFVLGAVTKNLTK